MKIIRFSAIWCSACLVMRSRWQKAFQNKNIEIIDYDYDIDSDKVKEYGIGKIIPVIVLVDGNNEIKRLIGEKSLKELEEFLIDVEDKWKNC